MNRTLRNQKILWLALLLITTLGLAQDGARYLIVTHDNFYSIVKPLADWKNQKGMMARVVKLSETGSTNTQIRNFIINAYNTWSPRPEYLLLVGSPSLLPSFYRYGGHHDNYYSDNEYGNINGDYRAEIGYGRLPARSPGQCSLMVKKILSYEQTPFVDDSLWFRRGTLIVNQDNDPDDTTYWNNVRFVANLMSVAGYVQIDTFSDLYGHNASNVVSAVTQGRSFVLYRGAATGNWYSPFQVNPALTNNGYKLPIICSFTCETMTLAPGESMVGEAWLKAGTVQDFKGGVAFVGGTHSGVNLARVRGSMTIGFFDAVFSDSVYHLGQAVLAGKNKIYLDWGNQIEYEGFGLLGDPEMCLWTTTPRSMDILYDSIIYLSQTSLSVMVQTELNQPISGALVCLQMDSTIYSWDYTDSLGYTDLIISPQHEGEAKLTVTAKNYLPFEGLAQVIGGSVVKEDKVNSLPNPFQSLLERERLLIAFSRGVVYNLLGCPLKTNSVLPGVYFIRSDHRWHKIVILP